MDKLVFDKTYTETILNNNFFEKDSYYIQQKPRYFNTLEYVEALQLPRGAKLLEIGGGQIALLSSRLFGFDCTVADVNDCFQDGIREREIAFQSCDLLHDDLEQRNFFSAVVMCEVIEHMPVPPHIVLEKIFTWIEPGGVLLLTTPNLYRLRNVIRLAAGMRVFDTFRIPERGSGIGHPLEYSREHLHWHIERAGFEVQSIELRQLDNAGATLKTQILRLLAAPLLLRPLWRDKLVAVCRKPATAPA